MRSLRSQTRAVVLVTIACAAFSLVPACGLTVTGLAEAEEGGTSLDGAAPSDATAAEDGEAGPQSQECSGERTTCPSGCTDLKTDPQNCGACGKACAVGENCNAGTCAVLCLGDTTACANVCVNTKTDPAHCGGCGNECDDDPFCVGGSCVPDCGSLTLCRPSSVEPYCADLASDPKNCGVCGKTCGASETCKAGQCVSLCANGATVGDVFGPTMVGCAAKIGYPQRGSLCPAGTHVCSPLEWVQRHGTKKPTYNYWTSVNLGWAGRDGSCSVDDQARFGWYACTYPMRVCTGYNDPLGNRCNWRNCGFQSNSPNHYFGGCEGNPTAGTLCCN
ncbi:MAG: hypothetical protein JST00_22205 [Deltaproteobacteria bacterium]|nr:hypothetical protein [Deltaproteobacteria bacterium]